MKRALLVCFSLLLLNIGYSQRNCGTMEYLDQQIKENPDIQKNLDILERYTKDFLLNKTVREQNGTVITIPVIVHVVYQNAEENISNAQITSQIDVLNDDFRRLNVDAEDTPSEFQGVASDTEIEFCLTQIVRVPTNVNSFGTNNSVKFSSSGGSDVINPAGAMNFWVCEIGGGILGYAQFPGGSPSTDGIVVDYRYFGTTGTATAPFDLGRTATHEVGHYLNLRHIWGDGGCNVDDFVADTPLAGGPNYTGSPCTYPGPNSCRPKGRPGQLDTFDMFQNYMDYSDDVCMNLFTVGQRDRMRAAISSSRPGLLTSSCTGNPVEICDNGIDDDGDGQIDCTDGDCATDPVCNTNPEICDNGIDDDGDGQIDCADGDCLTAPNCQGACDAPTGLTHERRKGGREGLLSWNVATGALSYYVEVYNSGGALHASGTVSGTSATVGGLTKNAAYTWRIRSNCSGGVTSEWATSSFNARILGNHQTGEVDAFPNPTNQDIVTVNWDLAGKSVPGIYEFYSNNNQPGNVRILVRDMNGRILVNLKDLGENRTTQLNTAALDAGIYFIQVIDAKGYAASTKLVKL